MNLNQKNYSHQVAMDPFPTTHRATEDSMPVPIKRESEGDPRSNQLNLMNWEIFAIWGFVIFTFAGLIFALYVIWAKCNDN